MSEREQYGELGDELDGQADKLAERNEQLGGEIADAREDWQRKRADAGAPGATPDWDDPDEEDDEDEDEDEDDKARDKDDDPDEDD
jgi:hypothetical protein